METLTGMNEVIITIHAKPITQGSLTAIPVKRKNGKMGATIIHSKQREIYEQREAIRCEYENANGTKHDGAVEMEMIFCVTRPKSVPQSKRPHMTVMPDLDKFVRAVLDSLTGYAYNDDSQVVSIKALKRYADNDGFTIKIRPYLG